MNRKVFLISVFAAAVVILAAVSPSITSKDIENLKSTEMINVEVNRFYGITPEKIINEMTYEETENLKEMLVKLNKAIENNDKQSISTFEKQLNDMNLFGENYQKFFSTNDFEQLFNKKIPSHLLKKLNYENGEDYSNLFCFINAIGKGILVSNLGVIVWNAFKRIANNASSFMELFVIIILFLPFVLTVIVLTSLIPFRILMPKGAIILDSGSLLSVGLKGLKSLKVTEQIIANISFFTGLSISIPGNEDKGRDPFVFVSGFALEISESDL
jgi:hypothetical protein